jgi:DNA invertase Pin-like site-specific DNA recombinase
MGELIGYGQVSTQDQSPDSQRDALNEAGCDKIFIEKVSSRLDRRPEPEKALEYARAGDVMVITRFARVARNVRQIIDFTETLQACGIDLIVFSSTSTPPLRGASCCSTSSPRWTSSSGT